jgi:hypothetical protein
MSWWDTGRGDDVIGDRPADALGLAFRSLGNARPTLDEVLGAIGEVLEGRAHELLEDPQAVRGARVAIRPHAEELATSGGQGRDEVRAVVDRALTDVTSAYVDRWERKPRLSEVLAALAFVLRPSPREWLSGPGRTLPIDDVVAERTGS